MRTRGARGLFDTKEKAHHGLSLIVEIFVKIYLDSMFLEDLALVLSNPKSHCKYFQNVRRENFNARVVISWDGHQLLIDF